MTLKYFIEDNKKEWFSLRAIIDMLGLCARHVSYLADMVKEEHKKKVDVRQVNLVCYEGLIPNELQKNKIAPNTTYLSSDDRRINVYQWFVDEDHVYQIADTLKGEHKQKVDVRQIVLVCYEGLIPNELQQNGPLPNSERSNSIGSNGNQIGSIPIRASR